MTKDISERIERRQSSTGESEQYRGCAVCGDQPRGYILGKPLCSVQCSEKLVNSELRGLDVSETTIDRFRQAKNHMDAADPNAPELTDELFLNTLLDTLKAVQDGYYTEDHTADSELREFIENWRVQADKDLGNGGGTMHVMLDSLEALLDE